MAQPLLTRRVRERPRGDYLPPHTRCRCTPIGLIETRNSPLFFLFPASENDVADVFTLFDELDEWLTSQMAAAFEWIRSGLAVRFDEEFRTEVEEAQREGSFTDYLDHTAYRQDMLDNMDYC